MSDNSAGPNISHIMHAEMVLETLAMKAEMHLMAGLPGLIIGIVRSKTPSWSNVL